VNGDEGDHFCELLVDGGCTLTAENGGRKIIVERTDPLEPGEESWTLEQSRGL